MQEGVTGSQRNGGGGCGGHRAADRANSGQEEGGVARDQAGWRLRRHRQAAPRGGRHFQGGGTERKERRLRPVQPRSTINGI